MRADDVVFGVTVKLTGSSPVRGMLLVTVIHGTVDTADQTHAFCSGPPHGARPGA